MRIAFEAWSPEYGAPLPDPSEPPQHQIDASVEVEPTHWAPIAPAADARPADEVLFLDGVRRVDAIAWITDDDGTMRRGLCASYAAGATRVQDGRARIVGIQVRRGVFTTGSVQALHTVAGAYEPMAVVDDQLDKLSQGVQERLGELEREVAAALGGSSPLILVDGPLTGRQNVPGAVGYIKTHRVAYLDEALAGVIAALQPGERTPLFLMTTSWTRYSWYVRLPGPAGYPWAGIVRLEASGDLEGPAIQRLANEVTVTLPVYASAPHKDPRAPQNLVPIGALERELRHRLGEREFVYRALRTAG